MAEHRKYSLVELLDRLGMDYDADRGKMNCFGCGKSKLINLNFDADYWRCPACGISGGVLHLFSRQILGREIGETTSRQEKIEVSKALEEYMEGSSGVTPRDVTALSSKPQPPKKQPVCVAPDDQLHNVYSSMQKLAELQLLPQHRENLLRRGLSDEAIQQNGYLSIPEKMDVPMQYADLYEQAGGERRRRKLMPWVSTDQIRFGLMIAGKLIAMGRNVSGVPGFFKFGHLWCYWCNPGIMIPTRNFQKQIVIWQVRRDKLNRKDDARYITVSSSKLPGHVTESVSRCHFPLGNAKLDKGVQILVTEGPLKADIACHLYARPVIFAAIPGIQTTKDLLSYCQQFRNANCKEIWNALDMDRLTNPNVRNGSDKLRAAFKKQKIRFADMYWDQEYAISKLMAFRQVAKLRDVPVPHVSGSVYAQLDMTAKALTDAGIDLCTFNKGEKNQEKHYWKSETKGIDDYLLSIR